MKLSGKSTGQPEQETTVRVEKVARGDLVEIVSAPGQIQPKTKVDQFRAQLHGAIASLEADRTSLTVERHQLDAAAAEILRAKDNLSYTTIVSPIDGIVTRMNAKVGEMVVTGTMNNMGTVILE